MTITRNQCDSFSIVSGIPQVTDFYDFDSHTPAEPLRFELVASLRAGVPAPPQPGRGRPSGSFRPRRDTNAIQPGGSRTQGSNSESARMRSARPQEQPSKTYSARLHGRGRGRRRATPPSASLAVAFAAGKANPHPLSQPQRGALPACWEPVPVEPLATTSHQRVLGVRVGQPWFSGLRAHESARCGARLSCKMVGAESPISLGLGASRRFASVASLTYFPPLRKT